MIVKGEIGQKVLLNAEIHAINVEYNYRDYCIKTEYTLKLHESDSLGNTYFKVYSDDVIFPEEPDVTDDNVDDMNDEREDN